MAYSTSVSQYKGPFDNNDVDMFFDDNPQTGEYAFPRCDGNGTNHNDAGTGRPFFNLFVPDMVVTSGGVHNARAGPSSETLGDAHFQYGQSADPQSSCFGNPIKLSVWPAPPNPYNCSFCQILREITHINGNHMVKLEIHGRLGIICHGILENRYGTGLNPPSYDYQIFDFCKESISSVKQFLVNYCEERKQLGYSMLQDPLLIFYEAMCVGLNEDESLDINDYLQSSPTTADETFHMTLSETAAGQVEGTNQTMEQQDAFRAKTSLSAQRERTGKLTLRDLIQYFHLPIEDAAKRMNVCPTVMKKICRKHGLNRWPYRKIKSLGKKIEQGREILNNAAIDDEERAQALADIAAYQQELDSIFAAFLGR